MTPWSIAVPAAMAVARDDHVLHVHFLVELAFEAADVHVDEEHGQETEDERQEKFGATGHRSVDSENRLEGSTERAAAGQSSQGQSPHRHAR